MLAFKNDISMHVLVFQVEEINESMYVIKLYMSTHKDEVENHHVNT